MAFSVSRGCGEPGLREKTTGENELRAETIMTNFEAETIFPNLMDPFLLGEFAFYHNSTRGVHEPS
jgi:hypothetical protein